MTLRASGRGEYPGVELRHKRSERQRKKRVLGEGDKEFRRTRRRAGVTERDEGGRDRKAGFCPDLRAVGRR